MIKEKDMIKPLAVMLIIAAFTFALVVFGLLQSSVRMVGRGTVKAVGVGIYWDSNCTNTVSFIDWGMVEPGSMNNVTVSSSVQGIESFSFDIIMSISG